VNSIAHIIVRRSLTRLLLRLPSSQVLLDRLDHLVAHLRSLCEARAEVTLDLLELLTVAFEVAERDSVGPVLFCQMSVKPPSLLVDTGSKTYTSSKCELQIIGHVRVVGDGVVDALVQQLFVAVEVLGNA